MFLPKRTQQHKTDTLAMKKVGLALGDDLLIRSMEERDYGIDAMVEHYEGETVGQMFFLQVKGKASPIDPLTKLVRSQKVVALGNFPKRTLMYAEYFVQPFVVAYTCVEKGASDPSPVYFLWLQRYIERVIDLEQPDWRESGDDNMTIYLPQASGAIKPDAGLKELANRALLESQSMRFVRIFAHVQAFHNQLDSIGATWSDPEKVEGEWIVRSLLKCKLVIDATEAALRSKYDLALSNFSNAINSADGMALPMRMYHVGNVYKAMEEIVAEVLVRGTEH